MSRFVVFFLTVLVLLGGSHLYVGSRLISTSSLSPPMRTLAWIAVAVLLALIPLGMVGRFFLSGRLADVLAWAAFLAMGAFSTLFVLSVVRDLLWLFAAQAGTLPTDPTRRQALLQTVNISLLGASAALTAFGVFEARRRARVVDVRIPIVDLPAALEGFRIVQVTDIHVGPTIKHGYLDAIVDGVNALKADLIAVTGDLVDGNVEDLRAHTAPLAKLSARHGAFFVTGNHEYYSGALEWIAEVERLGLRALVNAHHAIEHDGHSVIVAGVTDYNAGDIIAEHKSDPSAAIAGAPDAAVRILLAHQPRSAAAAEQAGFHLQLSGHTHGGQIFPWMFFVGLQQPFTAGLHRLNDLWVYVSRGTGYWGPPVRLAAPSEITCLTLSRA